MENHRGLAALILPAFLLAVATLDARATILFNNLTAGNGGSESTIGATWNAIAFTTDSTAYSQLSATLLLGQSSAGAPELDLYSTIGLEPKSLIKAFTAPAAYSSTPAAATFTASNLALTANTTYWLVLKANSGAFDWEWTNDFSVLHDWGQSTDSGATWFTSDAYPFQFSVTGTVPEPASWLAGLVAVAAVASFGRSRRRCSAVPARVLS